MKVLEEVERFDRFYDKQNSPVNNKFEVMLALFLTTVDEKISSEVELKIRNKYCK